MKPYHNRLTVPLMIFTVLVIISLACGSTTSTSAPKVSTATSETAATGAPEDTKPPAAPTNTSAPIPTDTPVPELYLGDAVEKYGYALTALTVSDPATPGMFYTAETGKKLVAVEIIVSNISGDMVSANPLYATLVDNEGFTYQAELAGVDAQLATVELNPGEKVKGWVAFKVDEKAIAASIKYSVEMFGGKVLQVSLLLPPEGHIVITESPSPAPAIPESKLGDVVEQFGYSLSAVTVEDPTTPGMFYKPRQGYKLVAIEIIVGNVSGSEALSVNPLYTYLVDNNGFIYWVELAGRDGQLAATDINAGEKVKGWVAFSIPEAAIPAYVKYQTEFFSSNYLITGVTK